MSLTGRTRSAIRAAILADWSARMTAAGLTLQTSTGSWAFRLADALSVDLLRIEGSAEALAVEAFPATCTEPTLDRMAGVQGQRREAGAPGRYRVALSAPSTLTATVDTTGRRVLSPSGLGYTPDNTSWGVTAGAGTMDVTAENAGEEYALDVGDVLTWDAAPTGLNPTVAVSQELTAPTAEEELSRYRARVENYRRGRPASGNPPDLIALATAQESVGRAWVYPTLAPDASSYVGAYADADLDALGKVVIVVVGPAQGSSPGANSLDLSADTMARVEGYFRGTHDAQGNPVGGSVSPGYVGRRFSSQLVPADFGVEKPGFTIVEPDLSITPTAANAFQWSGTMTVTTSTTTKVTVSGDHTAKRGLRAVFDVGLSAARGGWVARTINGVNPVAGPNTELFLDAALPDVASGTVYPAAGNDEAIRAAFFAFFDTEVGPRDVPSAVSVAPPAGITRRRRFPPESWGGGGTVYLSKLAAVTMRAGGVVNVTVNAPGADVTPATPKGMCYLGELVLRP